MKTIDEFCGPKNGYSRSITLRNKLIPVGKTAENLKTINILESDFIRAKNYVEVKNLIDRYHRTFISEILDKVELDWNPLAEAINNFQKVSKKKDEDKNKEGLSNILDQKDKAKKKLETTQSELRKSIVKNFTSDERFSKLFKEDILKELLPDMIKNDQDKESKTEILNTFKKFSTYFVGFHENRKNIYSEEEKSTAISYRIVNDNFPKFLSNIKIYDYIEKKYPEIITKVEEKLKNLLNGKKLKDIFSVNYFNNVLSQEGIDFYNKLIGGYVDDKTEVKTQGFNETINLARQQLPLEERLNLKKKMSILYKQILSDRITLPFISEGFSNSGEVYKAVKDFNEKIFVTQKEKIKSLYKSDNNYDLSKIYVPSKSLTQFSSEVCGAWSVLSDGLFILNKGNKKLSERKTNELQNKISKNDYSLSELQIAYEAYNEDFNKNDNCDENKNKKPLLEIKSYFTIPETKIENTDVKISLIDSCEKSYRNIDFEKCSNLQSSKDAAIPIKEYLDNVLNLYHYLNLVNYKGNLEKDSSFYEEYSSIVMELSGIIPIYNAVRNYVTKKPGEVKKVKLNFACPTLANGWDQNKESTNNCIIMLKDNNYYLGIFNPKNKPKLDSLKVENCTEDCYKKMVYKLLPGPNKMLPKVFISSKTGKQNYKPSEEILKGYNEKRHIKSNENFDINFCHDLIDFFKSSIAKHPDWSKMGFKFSDTSSYKDISMFYKEVESQGYKVTFEFIPEDKIDALINDGKLFLFQIYNKDFSKGSSGNKNLHTLYFENLFSEENLKDTVLKLNGEAQLFYRPANPNISRIEHEKGSILVNKVTKDGKTIDEEIYQEIYKYKNNMVEHISNNALSLLNSGNVIFKQAKHEIIKDRHFLDDSYLLHLPITMNFKASEIKGRLFNENVQKYLKDNPDVKIIGLDRGERHLIYLSLINQKGEIEVQKTLNIVNQTVNDKIVKIDYQDKLKKKEGDRDKARKSWQEIGNIKDMKEGYLSNVIHEIAQLMVENNAIVVMEDLNFGFKRGRFAVERQVYQKFENMLINKLNYLVFKNKSVTEPGGVLNAYQLTDKVADVKDVGKQCGWLFYIPAAWTSKIDPKTGFVNLFNLKKITNKEKIKEFFGKFDSIKYDSNTNSFVFSIDYNKFDTVRDSYKTKWDIYTVGTRIKYNPKDKNTYEVNPTDKLKDLFNTYTIKWQNGEELKERIQKEFNIDFFTTLFQAFCNTLQMRNSIPNTEEDYLISPVKSSDGTFYNSEVEKEKASRGEKVTLPLDADANGAYHIAMKGLYLLKNNFNLNDKGYINNITDKDWFEFIQKKDF